jgi:GT2 family glycosyltransferase
MREAEVAVVIPTRNRARYLQVTLASLTRQEFAGAHEVLVVDDGSRDGTAAVAERSGVRCLRHEHARGLNAARNTGVSATAAPLVAFLDDDVHVPHGWLHALVQGARRQPDVEAFGGPIRARLEGRTPSSCGREKPPITTLDLGTQDTEAKMVWGANLAIRRSALQRIGPFDETVAGHGDEEDWLLALREAGGRIFYLADAHVDHRRAGDDARLLALTRDVYRRARAARITDQRRGAAPGLLRELRVLTGCAWHTARRACPQGVIMGAHSAGRLAQAIHGPRQHPLKRVPSSTCPHCLKPRLVFPQTNAAPQQSTTPTFPRDPQRTPHQSPTRLAERSRCFTQSQWGPPP